MRLNEVLTIPRVRKSKHTNDGENHVDHAAIRAVISRTVSRTAMPRIKTMLRKQEDNQQGTTPSEFV